MTTGRSLRYSVVRRWRRARRAIAFVGVVVAATSCAPSAGPTRPVPSLPSEVKVTLSEYRFNVRPSGLPPGRVIFRFANRGRESHRPVLLRLDEGFPPIQEEVRNATQRFLLPFARIDTRPPRSTGTFAVELVQGQRYALVCFVRAADGQGHAYKGMTWEARAGVGTVARRRPGRDQTGGH